MVLINDPSFSFSSQRKKFSSLLWSQTSNCFSLVAGFHLKCWDVSISPLQAYSFRCWFSNNSVQFFFARMLSKLICGRSWHFILHYVIPMIYLLFFLPKALWCCSLHSSSRIEDHVLFVLIHSTGVLCSHSSSFILSSFASLFNWRVVCNPSYPLGHSFNSSGGSVLLISSSILSSFQVHVQFLPFTVGVLSKLYHS